MARKNMLPDFRAIFELGFAERALLESSKWHEEPSYKSYDDAGNGIGDLIYHWHASSIAGCTRAQILKRAGMAPDPPTVDSEMAFAFGHSVHETFESFLKSDGALLERATNGEWSIVSVEVGGPHPTLALKAKPDAVIARGKKLAVCDWKTEAGASKRIRKEVKESSGAADSVALNHKIQVTTGAMCAEARDGLPKIETGIVCYVSKVADRNKWDFEREEFKITDALRAEVMRKYYVLEEAWALYEETGVLPDRLPATMNFGKLGPDWHCRPRDNDDPRGKFCPSRSLCWVLPPEPTSELLP